VTTPAERLCSRSWRLKNSVWLLPAILLVGLLTWASFLYIGLKARKRTWLVASGIFGAGAVLLVTLVTLTGDGSKETSTSGESIMGGVALVVWIGGIVYGAIANREWLKWKAHADEAGPWYGTGSATPVEPAVVPEPSVDDILLGGHQPPRATPLPTPPPPPRPAPPPPPPPPPPSGFGTQTAPAAGVDVNQASSGELQAAFDLKREVAERIVLERERSGGFTHAEDLMASGAVEPHVFAGMRSRIVVGPRPEPNPPSTRGRKLDL
jgi:hypothetical protein